MQLNGSEHRPGQGVSAAVWRLSLLIGQCGPRRGTFGRTPAAWLLVLLTPALGNRPLGHTVCPHPSAPLLHTQTHSLTPLLRLSHSIAERTGEGGRERGRVDWWPYAYPTLTVAWRQNHHRETESLHLTGPSLIWAVLGHHSPISFFP